jgi:hypothetical protein
MRISQLVDLIGEIILRNICATTLERSFRGICNDTFISYAHSYPQFLWLIRKRSPKQGVTGGGDEESLC